MMRTPPAPCTLMTVAVSSALRQLQGDVSSTVPRDCGGDTWALCRSSDELTNAARAGDAASTYTHARK